MSKLNEAKYDELVWKNSRVFAKRFDIARPDPAAINSIVTELVTVVGINNNELGELNEVLDDPNYEAIKMGYDENDDGPGFGKDKLLDEGVYEVLKDAFRRIYDKEIYS